ncbi:alpha/beta fold hydrolase [Spirosoma arcticum]
MQPVHLLIGVLSNLFTLALLGTDVYLFREWYRLKDSPYDYARDDAQRYLIWAIGLVVLALLGGFIIKFLLGKSGSDEPTMERSEETTTLDRPEGHKLFIEFAGPKDAQPLILIHGWSSDSTQWYYLKKRLSQSYRLMLMDLPGLGKSGKPENKDYSLDKFARDLDAVIDLAGSRKPIVLGHSIGGMTILTYCKQLSARLSDRVAGLVLVHTTFTNPVKTSILSGLLTALERPVLRPLCRLLIWFAPLVQISNYMKYLNGSQHLTNHFTGFAGTETRGQLDHVSRLSASSPVGVIARGMLAMFDYDATAVLPTINVPVLVIAAAQDRLTKREASEYIAQHVPNAQLIVLQPSGHMGALERGNEMAEAVDQFGQAINVAEVTI